MTNSRKWPPRLPTPIGVKETWYVPMPEKGSLLISYSTHANRAEAIRIARGREGPVYQVAGDTMHLHWQPADDRRSPFATSAVVGSTMEQCLGRKWL